MFNFRDIASNEPDIIKMPLLRNLSSTFDFLRVQLYTNDLSTCVGHQKRKITHPATNVQNSPPTHFISFEQLTHHIYTDSLTERDVKNSKVKADKPTWYSRFSYGGNHKK